MRSNRGVPLAMFVVLSPLIGCASSAFQVSDDPTKGGVPFYVKSMVYRQHSVYEYGWLRVSLASAPVLGETNGVEKLGAKTTRVKDIADDSPNRAAVAKLQQLVAILPRAANLEVAAKAIEDAFTNLAALPPGCLKAPSNNDLRPAGNYVERLTVVDYSKPYYLNGKVPPFGSSNLSTELAADGTLAKGSNAVTGGGSEAIGAIASGLAGVLPIKEYLTSKWVPTPQVAAAIKSQSIMINIGGIGRVTGPIRYDIAIEPKAVLYDFTSDVTTVPNGASLPRVAADFTNGLYVMRPAEQAPEKASDDSGISFSGKVQVPTEKKP